MNIKKLLSGTLAATLAAYGVAWAATQTLSLGASTGPGGVLTLFGSTSGSYTIQTPAVAGTGTGMILPPDGGTNGQFLKTDGATPATTTWGTASGSGTVTSVICGAGLTGGTITTTGTCAVAAATFATGTTHTLVAPSEIWECTGTCTVTPPTPAAGYQFCVRNANNVATVITLAAIASTFYEKTTFTAYGTANTAATSGGAAGDKLCIVGKDSTHYDVFSFNGTWSMP